MSSTDKEEFSKNLIEWYRQNKRDLPWRNSDDPYAIWVSEIMLQQTRVDTVIPYYHRFLDAFPTVFDLAAADQQQVLKLWEGLGYYSRGRNLHYAAKHVVEHYEGNIPEEYKQITSLKGIGPYTAAAILSIAFQKKYAVVDGNVIRVIARYFGIEDDVRSSRTKNEVQQLADSLIPETDPGDFNQAMMELGATVCKPQQPECSSCPLSVHCFAFNSAKTDLLPYKSKAKKVPHHQIAVGIIVNSDHELLIALRPEESMLGGLWEFPGGKKKKGETLTETVSRELNEELGVEVEVFEKFMDLKHAYSHFKITLYAYWCKIVQGNPEPKSSQEILWVKLNEIDQFPFPKANKTLITGLKQLDDQNLFGLVSK
ncbi:MAG: A/G-specific adenine glycosylase [Balneolaceae bacterium]|nr:A/G-specific adenine glycosylase [Balneolaceae bacterium]